MLCSYTGYVHYGWVWLSVGCCSGAEDGMGVSGLSEILEENGENNL